MTTLAPAGDRYLPGGLAARQFPLMPRPRPPCRPVDQRLDRVARLAARAEEPGDDAPVRAAEACNLAALIASDCAMPDLAVDLCWQQFDAYAEGPHSETVAKLALQPLINLARLRIRGGDADGGYRVIESLYEAAQYSLSETVIDDRAVNIPGLAVSGSTRETITTWLWAALLSDGLRALCRAGRWADALRQAQAHNGVGQRLLDGRQIAILAHAADGRRSEAEHLLREAKALDPWERMVAACLRGVVRGADETGAEAAPAETADAYLRFNDPDHAMFSVCLGLAVAELPVPPDGRSAVLDKVASIATRTQDAYIAREILRSPVMSSIGTEITDGLDRIVHASGLGRSLSACQVQQLTESVRPAAEVLAG